MPSVIHLAAGIRDTSSFLVQAQFLMSIDK